MDAFGTAHRAQASTHGVAKYAPIACSKQSVSLVLGCTTISALKPVSGHLSKTDFPTIIFMQTAYNVYTVQQASRRSWRIGQTLDVKKDNILKTSQFACGVF
jgi:hypothetical protein